MQTSIGDLITAEGDLETAAGDATTAVDDESDALAGHSLSTSLDTTVASSAILQAATVALIGVMGPLTGAVSTVAAVLSGELVDALDVAAKGAVRFMNDFVAGIVGAIPTIEEASWLAGKPLADSFSSAADHVAGILSLIAGTAYLWGSSVAYSFADGIYNGMSAVEGAASALAEVVESYLGVHSNTELGALSDLMEWGPNVVKTFKKGIQGEMVSLTKTLNEMSLGGISKGSGIASSASGVATSATGIANSTGVVSKTVNLTINQTISNRSDADYTIKAIERLMKKPQII